MSDQPIDSMNVVASGTSVPLAPEIQKVEEWASMFNGPNPKLAVFDLDFTIWPFDCDKDVLPPFSSDFFGGVRDRYQRASNPYFDVPQIIAALVDANIPIAYASRNPSAHHIESLLRLIAICPKTKPHIKTLWDALPSREFFHAYSSSGYGRGKMRHFMAIQDASGIAFNDMVFFDDLPENVAHAHTIGVTSIIVGRRGLTWDAMARGIDSWRQKKASNATSAATSAATSVPVSMSGGGSSNTIMQSSTVTISLESIQEEVKELVEEMVKMVDLATL